MELINFIKPSLLLRQKRRDKRLSEKLLVCRRENGGSKNKKSRDSGDSKQAKRDFNSSTPRYRSSIKDNRDNTYSIDNPERLIKFLQSNCGKPWDLVYSNLSKQLDKRSTKGIQVLDQVWNLVILNVYIERNKTLIFTNRVGYQFPSRRNKFRNRFYVHPETRILTDFYNIKQIGPFPKKAKWKLRKQKEKRKARYSFSNNNTKAYVFKQIKTTQSKLVERQVYDLKIEKLNTEKKIVYFRIRLNKILKSNKEISLRVTILKSNDNDNDIGRSIILENDNVRSVDRRAYQVREKFNWEIFEPGHFYFAPKKNRETFNYQY